MAGTLYVVATPIGNLGDLSPRAQSILCAAELVVAEDTRHTGAMLRRLGATPRLSSLPGEREAQRIPAILERLAETDVVLVSDAGTPVISDPGRLLVDAARGAGYEVVSVPGPSALAAAVAGSGLRADRFLFLGFLPRTAARVQRLLGESESWALVFYESPHRLARTLEVAAPVLGERRLAVAREVSKLHESWYVGRAADLASAFRAQPARGECTVVVEAPDRERAGA